MKGKKHLNYNIKTPTETICNNKKAHFEYEILKTFEAGLELRGTEIKSIRDRKVNINNAYIVIKQLSAYIIAMDISPYTFGNIFNHPSKRERRLLLHKKEIIYLDQASTQKGLAIIPLSLYIKGPYAKLSVALSRGKKLHDKRQTLIKRDSQRELDRTLKNHR